MVLAVVLGGVLTQPAWAGLADRVFDFRDKNSQLEDSRPSRDREDSRPSRDREGEEMYAPSRRDHGSQDRGDTITRRSEHRGEGRNYQRDHARRDHDDRHNRGRSHHQSHASRKPFITKMTLGRAVSHGSERRNHHRSGGLVIQIPFRTYVKSVIGHRHHSNCGHKPGHGHSVQFRHGSDRRDSSHKSQRGHKGHSRRVFHGRHWQF
jgi:hypothetical protein